MNNKRGSTMAQQPRKTPKQVSEELNDPNLDRFSVDPHGIIPLARNERVRIPRFDDADYTVAANSTDEPAKP